MGGHRRMDHRKGLLMNQRKWRFSVVLLGLALVAGVIPAAQAGRSARVGASAAAAQVEGDGIVNYDANLNTGGFEKECRQRRGRRVCKTSATFTVNIPSQNDAGETPDQDECRYDRRVVLFEKTRRGRDRVATGNTGSDGSADFGTVEGVSRGDEYVAVVGVSTFSDQYGDLITCAAATTNTVTL